MSNKKSLLTESEIRRFMKLANIPVLKEESEDLRRIKGDQAATSMVQPKSESYGMEEEDEMPEEPEAAEDDSDMDLEMEPPAEDGSSMTGEQVAEAIVDKLAELGFVEKEAGGEATATAGMGDKEEGEPEEEEEEAGEGEEEGMMKEEQEEEEETEEEESRKMNESRLVDTVLSRVTARLIAEAAKKKKITAAEKKKEDMKKKAADMKKKKEAAEKKKKLEEANAPAPKSSMSNASKAGVAKAAGKADKGTWGVSSKLQADMKWDSDKGGHEMSAAGESSEHIISHGKKSMVTKGGTKGK